MISFPDVEAALARIRDRIYLSPCARTETLSRLTGTEAFLKLENLQMTGAYKERGALNKLLLMPEAERARGLIAASAGNHAQGVAYHAGRLGVTATIVMPETTPINKVANTRAHGARIVLHGANYDEAYAEARRLEAAEGLAFVHPFDDPQIIAGQGTVGLEVLEQVPEVDAVLVPIGGGGSLAQHRHRCGALGHVERHHPHHGTSRVVQHGLAQRMERRLVTTREHERNIARERERHLAADRARRAEHHDGARAQHRAITERRCPRRAGRRRR